MVDVEYVHPFREGNSRSQLYYLEQLTEQAGRSIGLSWIDLERGIAASQAAHGGDYMPMHV